MKASFSFMTSGILIATMFGVGACAPQKADDAEKAKEVQTVPLSTDTGPYIARVFQQRIQTEAETFASPTIASSMGLFGTNCVTVKEDSTDTDRDGIPMIRVSQIDCVQGTVTTKGKITLKDFDDNDVNGGFDLLFDNLVVTNQDANNPKQTLTRNENYTLRKNGGRFVFKSDSNMLFSQGTDNVFQTMKLERDIQPDFVTSPMRSSKWNTKGVIQTIINGRILTDLTVSSQSLHFNSACSASAGVRGGFDSGIVTMTDGTSSLQIEYLNCIERKATLNGKPISLDK